MSSVLVKRGYFAEASYSISHLALSDPNIPVLSFEIAKAVLSPKNIAPASRENTENAIMSRILPDDPNIFGKAYTRTMDFGGDIGTQNTIKVMVGNPIIL